VETELLITTESKEVMKFLTRIFSRHGIPEVLIITDNGPQFTSDTTKGFLDLYDVYEHYISTYPPESNGQVVNRNHEIGKIFMVNWVTIQKIGDENFNQVALLGS